MVILTCVIILLLPSFFVLIFKLPGIIRETKSMKRHYDAELEYKKYRYEKIREEEEAERIEKQKRLEEQIAFEKELEKMTPDERLNALTECICHALNRICLNVEKIYGDDK